MIIFQSPQEVSDTVGDNVSPALLVFHQLFACGCKVKPLQRGVDEGLDGGAQASCVGAGSWMGIVHCGLRGVDGLRLRRLYRLRLRGVGSLGLR